MAFEDVAVPFTNIRNRQCLTAKQVANNPWLLDFIKCFHRCFEFDEQSMVYWYYPEGDAPC